MIAACSLGEGEGEISSDDLTVAGCWRGQFQLSPDFFAAIPYNNTLFLRVQHGGDTEEVSDGAIILVDDIKTVRDKIAAQPGAEFRVALPPSIVPPGYPIVPDPDPALIHLTLYLHRSCHAQNSALYSTAGTIRFHSLFNGNLNETDADQKLSDADFSDITIGDPRDMTAAGGVQNTSHIQGRFKFYFQRGQPAQPFP